MKGTKGLLHSEIKSFVKFAPKNVYFNHTNVYRKHKDFSQLIFNRPPLKSSMGPGDKTTLVNDQTLELVCSSALDQSLDIVQ